MKVLVICEKSQTVCKAFREKRHIAISNDIQDCTGGHPEWHLKMDCFDAIYRCEWDLIIMHPPCTALSVSGNSTYAFGKPKYNERIKAIVWTIDLWMFANSMCDKVAMENPVGVLSNSKVLPKPQYIQPWQFGHPESKKTGLWLNRLPKLLSTDILKIPECGYWDNQTPSGQNKLGPSKDRAEIRATTYTGIAAAMAEQWGCL